MNPVLTVILKLLLCTLNEHKYTVVDYQEHYLDEIQFKIKPFGLPSGMGNRIINAPEAIDEKDSPTQPQPHLESNVGVPNPRWLLQHPSPLHGIRAEGFIPQKPSQNNKSSSSF